MLCQNVFLFKFVFSLGNRETIRKISLTIEATNNILILIEKCHHHANGYCFHLSFQSVAILTGNRKLTPVASGTKYNAFRLSLEHSRFVPSQYSNLEIIEAFVIGNPCHKPWATQKHIHHIVLLSSNGTMEGSIAILVLQQRYKGTEVK